VKINLKIKIKYKNKINKIQENKIQKIKLKPRKIMDASAYFGSGRGSLFEGHLLPSS
jgi:hypothetical protein